MYCLLESLAASLNPHNDHWRLRDEAANILARISRYGLLLLYSLCYPVKIMLLTALSRMRKVLVCASVLNLFGLATPYDELRSLRKPFSLFLQLLLIVYA